MRVHLFGFALAASLFAQDNRSPVPAIEDDPALPRVLLIGDSISIGYEVPVRKMLTGKANVHRVPGNAGPSSNGVFLIDSWLGEKKWDVIHFNFGLHDLKRLSDGKHQVGPEAYERYLRLVVERLQKTGAKLIWASTTPVPEGKVSPPRVPADVAAYNEIALRVMRENSIPVDDLYAFALPRLKDIQQPVNVHFTAEGSKFGETGRGENRGGAPSIRPMTFEVFPWRFVFRARDHCTFPPQNRATYFEARSVRLSGKFPAILPARARRIALSVPGAPMRGSSNPGGLESDPAG